MNKYRSICVLTVATFLMFPLTVIADEPSLLFQDEELEYNIYDPQPQRSHHITRRIYQ